MKRAEIFVFMSILIVLFGVQISQANTADTTLTLQL